MEVVELEVETIPYYNLGDLEATPEQSQETELIHEEVQHEEDVVTQEPASPKFSIKNIVQTEVCWDGIQKRDTATQEPIFLKSFVEGDTQTEVTTILMTEDAATQEPTFSITFSEASTQTKIGATLMEKDVVT